MGMQIGTGTGESSMEFPQKINNGIALWPSDFISGYLSEEIQNSSSKEYMHPYVHWSTIYNTQAMEATQVPINK